MKLSIVIPTYNAADAILDTVKSVLKQDLKNYEIIVVDDCSTDGTEKIFEKFSDNNVKYFRLETNQGVSHARNFGISKATGEYIIFLDSDDIQINNMSAKLLEKAQAGYDFVVCEYLIKSSQKDIIRKISNYQNNINDCSINDFIKILYINNLIKSPCNKIFSLKVINDNKIRFNEKISLGEDYRFNLDYITCFKDTTKFSYIDEVLYIYNRSNTGLSMKKYKDRTQVKLENWYYHKNIINNMDYRYLDMEFLKIIILGLESNPKIGNNQEIRTELNMIYNNNKSKKIRLIAKILLLNNGLVNKLIGFLGGIVGKS